MFEFQHGKNGFNPRLHAGGDTPVFAKPSGISGFNPRLHAGGDLLETLQVVEALRVSIHASTREATVDVTEHDGEGWGFNPRLHAGGDAASVLIMPASSMFQSTPPRGRRR